MRDEHIIALLDSDRFGSWSSVETTRIEVHVAQCDDCRHAYAAARAAAVLLQARAAVSIEPSPFFSTRVMALVREQQNAPSLLDLFKVWKTARGLVLSAASLVVLLGSLTFLTPQPNSSQALARTNYSTEGVVFYDDATSTDASPSNEQVMDVVFTAEDTDAGNQK